MSDVTVKIQPMDGDSVRRVFWENRQVIQEAVRERCAMALGEAVRRESVAGGVLACAVLAAVLVVVGVVVLAVMRRGWW